MASHSSILAWRIPWTGEPGGCKESDATEHTAHTVPGAVLSAGVNHPFQHHLFQHSTPLGKKGQRRPRWTGGRGVGGGGTQSHQLPRTQGGPSSNRGHLATDPHLHIHPLGVSPTGVQSGQLCPWAHTCCFVPGCHKTRGFPDGSVGKNPPAMQETGLIPGSRRFLGRRNGNPLQYFCRGKSQRQRSLAGYSPGSRKESDTTEHAGTHTHALKHSS